MKRLMFAVAALALGFGTGWSNQTASGGDAVLMAFSSSHCPPCRAMQPVLAELLQSGVPIRRVDVTLEPHLVARYGIRETPTFVVLSAGQEVTRLVGTQSATDLHAALAISTSGPQIPTGARLSSSADQAETPLGRITPSPAVRTSSGNAAAASDEPMPSLAVANAVERAEAATVRLRVHDGHGFGVGTGTIIDTHGDEALVMTCGHLFRETKGEGRIEVDLFVGGQIKQVPGQLVDYDANERDIALVAIRPGFAVRPVEVIRSGETVRQGQSVFSFGCDRGDDPSRRDTRITGVDKYNQHLGMSNIEIAGAPIDGRSGGGLFDQQGRLIGVCNAADYKGDVGIYTGPGSVHWQLDQVNLAHLYHSPARQQPQGERLASLNTAGLLASGGSAPASPAMPASIDGAAPSAINAPAVPSVVGSGAGNEVIVIIRDRNNPQAGARTLELKDASDQVIRMLEAESSR